MDRMFSTWHTHMSDRLIQVGAIIQTFLVVNIQIYQVVKNSNLSGWQKLKYFWLSKTHIILFVKNSNIFGSQKFKYFWLSKLKRQSTYFKFLVISDHCPWNHFVKSLSLISCRLAVKLERTRAKFCFAQNLQLAFQHWYYISYHPEEKLDPVLFLNHSWYNGMYIQCHKQNHFEKIPTFIIKMASESTLKCF